MKYLLTYKDAQSIVAKYNNHQFAEKNFRIDGYKLATFNYFLCGPNDFENPLGEDSDVEAYDMRGTTFTFDLDGKLVDTFYMLPKFFNLNQVDSTQYNVVKDKKIVNISVKEDGSLIGIMRLPNRKLFCKTMGGFDNDQSVAAYDLIHKNPSHLVWIHDLIDFGYTPLFEYVSFDNRIVLKYTEKQLRYIGARDNLTAEFIPANSKLAEGLFCEGIPDSIASISNEDFTLDELIQKSKTEEDKEGWVIMFEDGQTIKTKTEWYFNLHGIRTENIFREDYVIRNYLENKLDDIVAQLDNETDSDAIEFIEKVCLSMDNLLNDIDSKLEKLYKCFTIEFDSNWPVFATENSGEAYFSLFKFYADDAESYKEQKIQMIIRRSNKLNKARFLVEKNL